MLTRLTAIAAARAVSFALPIGLAVALGAAQPARAQAQYQCHSGHYDVVVPGYVSLPAAVDVRCSGSITTIDVQWPFTDPSPQAWHNHYEINAADMSVSITVGGQWLCTLQWIPTNGGRTRYVIDGCPEIYGGTGAPAPWDDPCIQKVRNRIYPDFWIFKHVIARNDSTGLRAIGRMLAGFEQGGPGGSVPDAPATEPGEPSGTAPTTPGFDLPAGPGVTPIGPAGQTSPYVPDDSAPPADSKGSDAPPAHPFSADDVDPFKDLERRPPLRR